jgi:hypothetical protein
MFADQGGLEPLSTSRSGVGDVDAGLPRGRDLAVAPSVVGLRGVGLQQDADVQPLVREMFAEMDQSVDLLSFLVAELHDVVLRDNLLRGHEPAPSIRRRPSSQKFAADSRTRGSR